MVNPYRKGYRYEKKAKDYMMKKYGCICIESRGSHSPIDLLCGNGKEVYAVQVKGGLTLPYIVWTELEEFAKKFKAKPLFLYFIQHRRFFECWNESDLKKLRKYLRDVKNDRKTMR